MGVEGELLLLVAQAVLPFNLLVVAVVGVVLMVPLITQAVQEVLRVVQQPLLEVGVRLALLAQRLPVVMVLMVIPQSPGKAVAVAVQTSPERAVRGVMVAFGAAVEEVGVAARQAEPVVLVGQGA